MRTNNFIFNKNAGGSEHERDKQMQVYTIPGAVDPPRWEGEKTF